MLLCLWTVSRNCVYGLFPWVSVNGLCWWVVFMDCFHVSILVFRDCAHAIVYKTVSMSGVYGLCLGLYLWSVPWSWAYGMFSPLPLLRSLLVYIGYISILNYLCRNPSMNEQEATGSSHDAPYRNQNSDLKTCWHMVAYDWQLTALFCPCMVSLLHLCNLNS